MAQEIRSTAYDSVILIRHGGVTVVGARGDRLRPVLRGGSWPGELSCERVWWTEKSSGR